jgi:hypothetical protein
MEALETLIDDICKMFSLLSGAIAFILVLLAFQIDRLRQRIAKLESKLAEKEQTDDKNI